MPIFKNSNETFWVIFKQCVRIRTYEFLIHLVRIPRMMDFPSGSLILNVGVQSMKLVIWYLVFLIFQPLQGFFLFKSNPSVSKTKPKLETINTLGLLLQRSQRMGSKSDASLRECLKLPAMSIAWYFFDCHRTKIPHSFDLHGNHEEYQLQFPMILWEEKLSDFSIWNTFSLFCLDRECIIHINELNCLSKYRVLEIKYGWKNMVQKG